MNPESETPGDAARGELDSAGAEAHHAGKPGKGGKPAPGKRDKYGPLIVMVSVVGVIIAWMTYRSSASKSAAVGATGLGSAPSPYAGNVAGSGGTNSDAQAGLSAMLDNLSAELATLTGNGSGTGIGSGTPSSPSNVPDFVRFVNMPGAGGSTIWDIENGTAHRLTWNEFVALGKPQFDTVTTQDTRYQYVLAGQPAPPPPPAHGPTPSPLPAPGVYPVTGRRPVKPS